MQPPKKSFRRPLLLDSLDSRGVACESGKLNATLSGIEQQFLLSCSWDFIWASKIIVLEAVGYARFEVAWIEWLNNFFKQQFLPKSVEIYLKGAIDQKSSLEVAQSGIQLAWFKRLS